VDFLERHPELGQVTPAKLTVEQKEEIRSRIAAGDTRVSVIAREYGVSRGLIYKFAGDLLTPQDEVG
jgi:transposase-like protein